MTPAAHCVLMRVHRAGHAVRRPTVGRQQPKPVWGRGAVVGLDRLGRKRGRWTAQSRNPVAVRWSASGQVRSTRSQVQPSMAVNWQCRSPLTPAIGATEPHVDPRPMARALLLVPLRALGAALAALVRRQSAQAQSTQYLSHPRGGDLAIVAALEVHRDARGAEAAVSAQVHDPFDDLARGGRAVTGQRVAVPGPSGPSSPSRFFHLQDTVRLIPQQRHVAATLPDTSSARRNPAKRGRILRCCSPPSIRTSAHEKPRLSITAVSFRASLQT